MSIGFNGPKPKAKPGSQGKEDLVCTYKLGGRGCRSASDGRGRWAVETETRRPVAMNDGKGVAAGNRRERGLGRRKCESNVSKGKNCILGGLGVGSRTVEGSQGRAAASSSS